MKAPQVVIERAKAELKRLDERLQQDEVDVALIRKDLRELQQVNDKRMRERQQISDWLRSQGESV